MTDMFERFTERAREVISLAAVEARRLDHPYVGTEHLLLGLTHQYGSAAHRALASFGISPKDLRAEIEQAIGRGPQAPSGSLPLTPRLKKVLELSVREALHLGADRVGTDHILLGVIGEGGGVAAHLLKAGGVSLERARERAVEASSQGG